MSKTKLGLEKGSRYLGNMEAGLTELMGLRATNCRVPCHRVRCSSEIPIHPPEVTDDQTYSRSRIGSLTIGVVQTGKGCDSRPRTGTACFDRPVLMGISRC